MARTLPRSPRCSAAADLRSTGRSRRPPTLVSGRARSTVGRERQSATRPRNCTEGAAIGTVAQHGHRKALLGEADHFRAEAHKGATVADHRQAAVSFEQQAGGIMLAGSKRRGRRPQSCLIATGQRARRGDACSISCRPAFCPAGSGKNCDPTSSRSSTVVYRCSHPRRCPAWSC